MIWIVMFGLGLGILGATGREIAAYGLDGLSLFWIIMGVVLIYYGGRESLGR